MLLEVVCSVSDLYQSELEQKKCSVCILGAKHCGMCSYWTNVRMLTVTWLGVRSHPTNIIIPLQQYTGKGCNPYVRHECISTSWGVTEQTFSEDVDMHVN